MAKRLSYSNLLIAESPMLVSPLIAFIFHDSDKAIILQHFYYWTHFSKAYKKNTKIEHEGKLEGTNTSWVLDKGTELLWVYHKFEDWQKVFYWLKIGKVTDVIQSLVKEGYLIAETFNKMAIDRTLWYAVNPYIGELIAHKIQNTPRGPEFAAKILENQRQVTKPEDLPLILFKVNKFNEIMQILDDDSYDDEVPE